MNYKELKAGMFNHPNPLFRRDSFIDLNGEWDFLLETADVGEREPRFKKFPENHLKINVPYCYQCELSGINNKDRIDTVWYQKDFHFDHKEDESVILHFEGSDYLTWVYVNKKLVGKHQGGYTSFSFDITKYLINGNAHIAVRCDDSYNLHQPRGKQKWRPEPFGCWYQEVTGIWKPVWAEIVKKEHISFFKLTPFKNGVINITLRTNEVSYNGKITAILKFDSKIVGKKEEIIQNGQSNFNIDLDEIYYWDCERPNLYDVELRLDNVDVVFSKFGYRFIEARGQNIFLNNNPLFMRLCLEQGYYKEGIYTFKDMGELIKEISIIKESGFNGLRMHQKVEDQRFYYACDLVGLIVWSEMPSPYDFDDDTRVNTINEWKEVLAQHYNHPSIFVWTPVNESWGVPGIRHNKEQHDFLVELYDLTKEFDNTRLVVSNDGWEHCKTDIVTLHNYIQDPEEFKRDFTDSVMDIILNNKQIDKLGTFVPFADGFKYEGQPIMVDEFCGIGFNVQNVDDGWGYGDKVQNINSFLNRYKGLVEAATKNKLFAGWCMTQITDVYQEVNGLYTIDRINKFPVEEIAKINTTKRE